MRTLIFLFFLLSFNPFSALYGQIYRHFQSEDFEKTFYSNAEWKQKIREKEIEFYQYYNNEFLLFEEDINSKKDLQLVFNILQTEDKKVTLDNIKYQLKALNAAFNNEINMPDDDFYKDQAFSAGIQFCVPEFSDEFIRIFTLPKGTIFRNFFDERGEKGLQPYEPGKYINIWVADLGQYNPQGQEFSIAGYAQLPMRDPMKDGIVLDIDHFGSQPNNELYKKGYTLAHLMGIYLGLRPLWGLDGVGQCGGDHVDDTPTHGGPTLICLPQTINQLVVSQCWGNERIMNRNFMDNIPDDCAAMFTLGQRRIMHANLGKKGPRGHLVSELPFKCNTEKETFSVDLTKNATSKLTISPNPAFDVINVRLDQVKQINNKLDHYIIYNLMGLEKARGNIDSNEISIQIQNLPSGMYFFVANLQGNDELERVTSVFEVIR